MKIRHLTEDVVVINNTLNPKIWNYDNGLPALDEKISKKLIEIAKAFYKFVDIDLNVIDVILTGSNANFTWNVHSDLDLHLLISGMPDNEHRELFNAKKSLWGDIHDITIKGYPVELYVQGSEEPHYSTGVYSILHNKWKTIPTKVKPHINDAAIELKKDHIMHLAKEALTHNDKDKLNKIKENISKMRKAGLEKTGEWSIENLVFKALRNNGMLDTITNKIHELEDQELSLEQFNHQI